MIHVRIELWPRGSREGAKHLGTIEIANVGGDSETGSYEVELKTFNGRSVWKRARVEGFQRRELGGYDLVYRALEAAVGFRNRGLPIIHPRSSRDIEKRARAWLDGLPSWPWKAQGATVQSAKGEALFSAGPSTAEKLSAVPEMMQELLLELERSRGQLEAARAALREKGR